MVHFRLWSFELFPVLLIHVAFLLRSIGSHISLQNCFLSWSSSCWYVLGHSPPTSSYNFFRCFEMSCFVSIAFSSRDIFLIYLLPPVNLIYFLELYCLLNFLSCFFSFRPNKFQNLFFSFFSLILFACFYRFLIVFPVEFPMQVFSFSSCSSRKH